MLGHIVLAFCVQCLFGFGWLPLGHIVLVVVCNLFGVVFKTIILPVVYWSCRSFVPSAPIVSCFPVSGKATAPG